MQREGHYVQKGAESNVTDSSTTTTPVIIIICRIKRLGEKTDDSSF